MFSKKVLSLLKSPANGLQKCAILTSVRTNNAFAATQEPSKVEKTINTVQLLGRVGAPPQMKGNDQHPMAVFSLATHTNYRYETGEFMQRTEWHRVICFKPGLRDSIMNYMKKGQRVFVSGKITYGEVKTEEGGMKVTTAIQADDVIFFQYNQDQ